MTIKFCKRDTPAVNMERRNVESFLILSDCISFSFYDNSTEELHGEYEVWSARE